MTSLVIYDMIVIMIERTIIHQTYVDIEAEPLVPLKTYYTQNPIPEGRIFTVQYKDHILTFRLDQHFVSDEKVSLIKLIDIV